MAKLRKTSRNMEGKWKKKKRQSLWSFKITFQDLKNGKRQKIMQLPRAIELSHGNILIFSATTGTGIFRSYISGIKIFFTELTCILSIWAACAMVIILAILNHTGLGMIFPKSRGPIYFFKRFLGASVSLLSLWIKLFVYLLRMAAHQTYYLLSGCIIQLFYAGF